MKIRGRKSNECTREEKIHAWIVEWTNVSMLNHKAISQI